MGYSIYYDRAFIRVGDNYIPLVNCGSSNSAENVGGRWVPDKNWEVLNWKRWDRVLFSASEILDIARDYELGHQENGMSFKSRSKPFAPGEFERWIVGGMKRTHSIEEYLTAGNELFVVDFPDGRTEKWRRQPFSTAVELLDIIKQLNDGREIDIAFGNNRELHRPAVSKTQDRGRDVMAADAEPVILDASGAAEPAPHIKAENTDLAALVYKIHALAGNFATDANYNVSKLAGGSEHYMMLMSDRNIFVCETGPAYYRDTTAHDIWKNWFDMSDGLRAFALHVTECEGGRVLGSITEIDAAERQRDILEHSFSFMQIDATLKNGTKRTFTPNEWDMMELIDRDRVQSWVTRYDMADLDRLLSHLKDVHEKQEASVRLISPDELLSDMSRVYMEAAENPQPDMLRVNLSAARELLARSDAPVYRLLPDGAELLNPIDSIRKGLGFAHYREFAIKREDMAGFNKWAERGADIIVRTAVNRAERDKPHKSHGQEH